MNELMVDILLDEVPEHPRQTITPRCTRCYRDLTWDDVDAVWVHADNGYLVCRNADGEIGTAVPREAS